MTDKELMLSEQLYMCGSAELAEDFKRCRMYTRLFNSSTEEQQDYRKQLIKELFKSTGKNFYIEPPFRCDYGCNISIGENFYSNFDLIILDVCDVSIGNNVFIAPRVSIFTAAHPIDKDVRNAYLENEIKLIIAETGASSMKEMGKVMGLATKQLAGKAEGRAISEMVKKLLV